MEQKKYVSNDTLEYYDPKIKTWFEEKVNAIPLMDIIYDEVNRTLEFVETTSV